MDLTWNRIVHHGKLFMSGWNFPSYFRTKSFPKEFWWVTAVATHRWLVFSAGLVCFCSYCMLLIGWVSPFEMCLKFNCISSVLYWKMYGFVEAIIFHMEKELGESRNCEAKQELKDPEAFQQNEFWWNSIFTERERRRNWAWNWLAHQQTLDKTPLKYGSWP